MTATAGVMVQGTVLETEHRKGSFVNDSGETIAYDFKVTSVLCGTRVVEVRFNPDNGDAQPPADGAVITVLVDLPKGVKPMVVKKYVEAAEQPVRRVS